MTSYLILEVLNSLEAKSCEARTLTKMDVPPSGNAKGRVRPGFRSGLLSTHPGFTVFRDGKHFMACLSEDAEKYMTPPSRKPFFPGYFLFTLLCFHRELNIMPSRKEL